MIKMLQPINKLKPETDKLTIESMKRLFEMCKFMQCWECNSSYSPNEFMTHLNSNFRCPYQKTELTTLRTKI